MVGIDKQIAKRLKVSKQANASNHYDDFSTPWGKII